MFENPRNCLIFSDKKNLNIFKFFRQNLLKLLGLKNSNGSKNLKNEIFTWDISRWGVIFMIFPFIFPSGKWLMNQVIFQDWLHSRNRRRRMVVIWFLCLIMHWRRRMEVFLRRRRFLQNICGISFCLIKSLLDTVFENHTKKSHLTTLRAKRATFPKYPIRIICSCNFDDFWRQNSNETFFTQWLNISQTVSFYNIASEASYVYSPKKISRQKKVFSPSFLARKFKWDIFGWFSNIVGAAIYETHLAGIRTG